MQRSQRGGTRVQLVEKVSKKAMYACTADTKVRVYFYLPCFLSLAGDPHLQLHHTGKWSAGLWKELGNPKDPRTRLTITDETEELLHKLWLNMDQNSKAANTNHNTAIPYSACSGTPKE